VIEFLEQIPDYADPGFVDVFANCIAKLDPRPAR
jgi:hypothetical protein